MSCKPSRGLLVGLATRLHVGVTWLQALENLTSCPQLSREPLFHRLSSTLWSGRTRPMRRAASSPSSRSYRPIRLFLHTSFFLTRAFLLNFSLEWTCSISFSRSGRVAAHSHLSCAHVWQLIPDLSTADYCPCRAWCPPNGHVEITGTWKKVRSHTGLRISRA